MKRPRLPAGAALAAASLAATSLVGARAGAQVRPDSARADSARADSARARRIVPVVVTVLRTPIEAGRAPFAVSANGPEDVRRARPGLALDEALRNVPGVQVDNRFNAALGERISVRGFGARTQFGVRGVKVLVDGVPATMPDGQTSLNHVELGALERAEVERGPASALYGNAAGGVLLLESERAPDAPVAATARAVTGSDGLARWQAGLGGRAGGADWALRGSRLRYDGFRQFSSQRSTRVTGRAGAGEEARGLGALRASLAWVDYDADNPGSLPDSTRRRAPTSAWPNNVRQRTGEDGRHGQLGLAWRRAVPGGALDASAWGLRRKLDNPIPPTVIALDRRAGGARLAYGASVMGPGGVTARLTAGGELQRQRDDRQNWVNSAGVAGARTLDQLEHVTTAAAFAQADAALGDRVTILAGLRRDRARFAADDRLVTAANPDDSGERVMGATSPSIGVSVGVLPRLRLYANASRGFETPTTTELANRPTGAGGFNPTLRPQRARSVEAGLNGSWSAGLATGTAQLAAYDTRLADALLPFEVPGAAGRQFFRNAGRARHRGLEAAATAGLGANLLLRAAYTFVDARFSEYVVGDSSYAGRRVPGVAPRRLDAAVEWREGRGAFVAFEGRAQSWTPTDDANRGRSSGYFLSGLRGAWRPIRLGGAELVPFAGGTNLFDVRWDAAVTVNAAGARYFEPGPGRSVYLGADLAIGGRR